MTLVLEQALNGVQLGVLLFLLAAGLTLVFGIMNFVNLAHGSLYMVGAYFAATFIPWSGSLVVGAVLALAATALVGMGLEVLIFRRLYHRDHMDQVLATFGLILFFNELVLMVWGPAGMTIDRYRVRHQRHRGGHRTRRPTAGKLSHQQERCRGQLQERSRPGSKV